MERSTPSLSSDPANTIATSAAFAASAAAAGTLPSAYVTTSPSDSARCVMPCSGVTTSGLAPNSGMCPLPAPL